MEPSPATAEELQEAAEALLHKPIWHVASSRSSGTGFVMRIGPRRPGSLVAVHDEMVELPASDYSLGVIFDCGWCLESSDRTITSWQDEEAAHRIEALKELVGLRFERVAIDDTRELALELTNGTRLRVWPRSHGRYQIAAPRRYIVVGNDGRITRHSRD
jgi:hypothetical protein